MSEHATTGASGRGPPSPRSTTLRTITVTLFVCLACSMLVSISTVVLRPIQRENQRQAREAQIAAILTREPALRELLGDVNTATLESRVVELVSGTIMEDMDAAALDPVRSAREPESSRELPAERDLARIQRQARHVAVTFVRREGTLHAIVVPIYGRGYGSIIRGSLALAGDANTIIGLAISEHGETPGIGSEITEPEWTGLWPGKKLRDDKGQLRIHVALDETSAAADDAEFHVDGISGATKSCDGVGNMVRFWVGEDGFGPFLGRVGGGEIR